MKSRILCISTLIELGACGKQVNLFRSTFGDSIEVTSDLCKKYAQTFGFYWAASYLLDAAGRKLFIETNASALKLFIETCAPEEKFYEEGYISEEICASASKFYDEIWSLIWKHYEKIKKSYRETDASRHELFIETFISARKLYEETGAIAFANLYTNQGEQNENQSRC